MKQSFSVSLAVTHEDVRLEELQAVVEPRGQLVVGEWGKQIPFIPKRFFLVSDVPAHELRSNHAHREQHLFVVCLRDVCLFHVDDGRTRREIILDRPTLGLYIPPGIWTQYESSAETLLLVLASEMYDPCDYIQDYDEFLRLKRRERT